MKKIITISELLFIFFFIIFSIKTNNEPCSRIYFLGLEISAVSIYHIYEKFKNRLNNS